MKNSEENMHADIGALRVIFLKESRARKELWVGNGACSRALSDSSRALLSLKKYTDCSLSTIIHDLSLDCHCTRHRVARLRSSSCGE